MFSPLNVSIRCVLVIRINRISTDLIDGFPAKNALIIQISFKLGLRAQEMALLRIHEIAALSDEFSCGYKIRDVLVLPKSFTKDTRAMAAIGNKTNERTSVCFTVAEFDRLVADRQRCQAMETPHCG